MSAGAGVGRPTVVVVGGGIAGLAGAWELTGAPGAPHVVVLEAGDRLGGKIVSAPFGGRTVDLGPDAVVARRPEAVTLFRELGLDGALVAPGARTAYLFLGGRLRPLPPGLALGVPTHLGPLAGAGILSAAGLGRVAADICTPPWAGATDAEDEAIGSLLGRRLGREVVERLADPLIGGIHAGTVDSLSAAAVFPALLDAARHGGSLLRNLRRTVPAPPAPTAPTAPPSPGAPPAPPAADAPVFVTVRGGLGAMVEHLAGALSARGAELCTGRPVERLRRADGGGWTLETGTGELHADAVLLAVPAPAAALAVADAVPALAAALGALRYSSVTLLTMRFAARALPPLPPGTGYLVPRHEGALLTACTWLSAKWPALAHPDDVLVRVSAGRFGDDRPEALDDDELVARALEELGPAVGVHEAPLETRVTRFVEAFPQYEVGHLARVAAMEAAAARAGGLALAGAALRGVGIPACIASGRQAAARLLDELATAGVR